MGEGHMSMCPQEYSCECVKHPHVNPVFEIFTGCMSECLGSMSCNPPYGCVSLCVLGVGVPLYPCGYLYLHESVYPLLCVQTCLSNYVHVCAAYWVSGILLCSLCRPETS